MKLIALTKGYTALVDDSDYDDVAQFLWSADVRKTGVYAVRYSKGSGNRGKLYLHRALMGDTDGLWVDHRNGNPLDNQRRNLRLCTKKQNSANNRRSTGNTGYRGVTHRGTKSKVRPYQSQIAVDGRNVIIGYFLNVREAAEAYDKEARRLFGSFAKTNFPVGDEMLAGSGDEAGSREPVYSIQDLEDLIEWCLNHKRSPAHWQEMLKIATEAQLKAEVKARKRSKAA